MCPKIFGKKEKGEKGKRDKHVERAPVVQQPNQHPVGQNGTDQGIQNPLAQTSYPDLPNEQARVQQYSPYQPAVHGNIPAAQQQIPVARQQTPRQEPIYHVNHPVNVVPRNPGYMQRANYVQQPPVAEYAQQPPPYDAFQGQQPQMVKRKDLIHWTKEELQAYLKNIGFEEIASKIGKEGIDGEVLKDVVGPDLDREMARIGVDIRSIVYRKKFRKHVYELAGVEFVEKETPKPKIGSDLGDLSDFTIVPDEIDIVKELGSGAAGVVYLGSFKGTEVAVKQLKNINHDKQTENDFKEELRALKHIRHPNVILLMGVILEPPPFAIVTEFCKHGSLYDVLSSGIELSKERIHSILVGSCKGLLFLHSSSPPVIHRDLKSPNILVTENWTPKIADFGLSKTYTGTQTKMQSTVGSPLWMAPEVMMGRGYDGRCDVYSFGLVMWEVFERELPFGDKENQMQLLSCVTSGERPLFTDKTPMFYRDLISRCWNGDPMARPSFLEILRILESVDPNSVA